MATITITKINQSSDSITPLPESSFYGRKLSCKIMGAISHVETTHSHIFIIGYIQDNDYLHSKDKAEYFSNENILDNITKLNGHYSLIKVCKNTDQFTVFSNKSGGNRVYLRQNDSQWIISQKLSNLVTNNDTIENIALEEEFLYRWITGEHSLIKGVYQVPSGHYWLISQDIIKEKIKYFSLPIAHPERYQNESLESLTSTTHSLLTTALNKMVRPRKKVAILLSGGVDSSILAAMAHHAGHELVAISHRSLQHENPELNTAIKFAKTLNIEHRIIDIDDNEIACAFKQCSKIIEQAPRFQSSIILFLLFSKLEGEFYQVIYGEAADTLFGNNTLKRYLQRYKKRQHISTIINAIPLLDNIIKLLPQNSKISMLLNESVEDFIRSNNQLALNDYSINYIRKITSLKKDNYSFQQLTSDLPIKPNLKNDLLKIKRFALNTDVDNHFHETGALANHFNIEIISPFVDIDVINFASQLPVYHTIAGDNVKPILRKIGEMYFKSELMYLPKKGFPAPHLKWLETCLRDYVITAAEYLNISDPNQLDTETQWTIAALDIVLQELNIKY
ncbi:asparagine synthase C-terminal domain-containing protein [Thalassotalea sp. G2M2-11]|uniref:asparagine synthase-related protein n=1 Tax=Thalassotalea sp. G2M2-11 TaxID=2787627 RepID=UPI0019D0CAA9|nr:asparagine synthase C-terminal domain-containing protein [Thalassotalea sp. G2M2-11]